MALLVFLLKVFVISLSGAMQPGPVTATAIAIGTRNKYAGILMAVGHAVIELPLMILIMMGIGKLFASEKAQIAIGLAGGTVLLVMAIQMLVTAMRDRTTEEKPVKDKPVLAGLVLSGSNPYFLIWWATIGLKLATDAREFGIWSFPLFALTHWLCDGGWLQGLSWTSFKGATLLGPKKLRIVLLLCSGAMFLFGLKFIYDSVSSLVEAL